MSHLPLDTMLERLDDLRAAPANCGTVDLIVGRPDVDQRDILSQARLTAADGLVGDSWGSRFNKRHPDGTPDPDKQITVMNARAARLVADSDQPEDFALAGDQLFLDLDISHANLPAGARLMVGDLTLVVSENPHNGCAKFAARFGQDAVRFVNSPEGKALRLRGLNARVANDGWITQGDKVTVVRG